MAEWIALKPERDKAEQAEAQQAMNQQVVDHRARVTQLRGGQ